MIEGYPQELYIGMERVYALNMYFGTVTNFV
jgi:hypothetical protein